MWRAMDSIAGLDYRLRAIERGQKEAAGQRAFLMRIAGRNSNLDTRVATLEAQEQQILIRLDGIDRNLYLINRQLQGGGNPRLKKDVAKRRVSLKVGELKTIL